MKKLITLQILNGMYNGLRLKVDRLSQKIELTLNEEHEITDTQFQNLLYDGYIELLTSRGQVEYYRITPSGQEFCEKLNEEYFAGLDDALVFIRLLKCQFLNLEKDIKKEIIVSHCINECEKRIEKLERLVK